MREDRLIKKTKKHIMSLKNKIEFFYIDHNYNDTLIINFEYPMTMMKFPKECNDIKNDLLLNKKMKWGMCVDGDFEIYFNKKKIKDFTIDNGRYIICKRYK